VVRLEDRVDRAVGDKTAKGLAALGVQTVGDLLRHYPRRYAERGALTPVGDLRDGEHVTVVGEVVTSSYRIAGSGKPLGEVVVTDGSGRLVLTFFGKAARWNADRLRAGRRGLFAGTVSTFRDKRQLTHPDYVLDDDVEGWAGALLPVYPASKDISSWNIAKAVRTTLDVVDWDGDPLPDDVRRSRRYARCTRPRAGRRSPPPAPASRGTRRSPSRSCWPSAAPRSRRRRPPLDRCATGGCATRSTRGCPSP
jgi:ATP-dependent DNA helicase RecG